MSSNFKKINLKRKVFSKGKYGNFKRFKRTPKFIANNPENYKKNDVFDFTDDEEEEGKDKEEFELPDLNFLDDSKNKKELIALTQDTVRPIFNEDNYDETKINDALAELKFKSFRPFQLLAIKRILFGRSTLFISPTGSGKSLCYQLPALINWRYCRYITIVVSPLISLMEDQMSTFPTSLKAVSLHSGLQKVQRRRSIDQLVAGEAQVAFISPEAIVGGALDMDDLRNLPPIGFVCVDEAHCLSEWSHNFRPSYLQFLKILNDHMGIKTYLGLTATATKTISRAISRNLGIDADLDVVGSTRVPSNLILSASCENNKDKALIDMLKTPEFRDLTSIIIYCNRREDTEHVAMRVRTGMQNYSTSVPIPGRKNKDGSNESQDTTVMKLTWHAEAYHAGMGTDARKRIQRQFIKGELRVVCATIAFGMGINKANVRAIIHYDMPSSFEGYIQEVGRAGRDGNPAQCHMFLRADKTDLYYQQRNIYASTTERKCLRKLTEMIFRPCRCAQLANEEELARLKKLNDEEPSFLVQSSKGSSPTADENQPKPSETKVPSKVLVHRPCQGHEVSFSIDYAISDINLRAESIMTLICELEQSYPQLKIKQFNPSRSTCNLLCYHGKAQMEKLAKSCIPVRAALLLHRQENIKTLGEKGETPNKLSFDMINIAAKIGKPSAEVSQMLRQSEWEYNKETGKFKRSQIRVNFEGNSFHLQAVGDLSEEEKEEVKQHLYEYTRNHEHFERERVNKVFQTFIDHSIDMKTMNESTSLRSNMSAKLKRALDIYFDPDAAEDYPIQNDGIGDVSLKESNQEEKTKEETRKLSSNLKDFEIQSIQKDTRAFLSAHGRDFTPRTIAKIFQGISTPNYPAEHWGRIRKFWRSHLNIDFLELTRLIQEEML